MLPQTSNRILVIADSKTQSIVIESFLKKNGFIPTVLTQAHDALLLLENECFDLILADYLLPDINGEEFCRRVRMRIHSRGLPILMISPFLNESSEISGLESGADSFIGKGDSEALILLKIRSLLKRSPSINKNDFKNQSYFSDVKILVIDDCPVYQASVSEILSKDGFKVLQASSAKAGLQLLESTSVNCILIDLIMSEVDGIEFCKLAIQRMPKVNQNVPILLMTGREKQEDQINAFQSGADDFLIKTGNFSILRARVRALLRRNFFMKENQKILNELEEKERQVEQAQFSLDETKSRASLT
jgi:DNA-binding response OmpR family regulator